MTKKTAILAMLSMCLVTVLVWTVGLRAVVVAEIDATPTRISVPDPVEDTFTLDSVANIDLLAYPSVPEISENARQLYKNGLARGKNPNAFIKVGDCMTDNPFFLRPIGEGDYALGDHAELQLVIDQFITEDFNAFSRISQAAAGGFNSASLLDSLWANPEFCEPGETPLACEMRIAQPGIALIMFGTNDVFYLSESQFDFFLRSIVAETIRRDALPILSTFPHRPEFPEKSMLYNQVVVRVALDYDVPLINLWGALVSLPNQGVDAEETTHLSAPPTGAVCHFIGENMQSGFTVRNLLTLQTLNAVLESAALESGG